MSVIEPGQAAPEFVLATEDAGTLTHSDIQGQRTLLIFYPFAFSPVCTEQLQLYERELEKFEAAGVKMYGVSCDAAWSQSAFREKLGVSIPQLSDFEPKGAACEAFGVLHPGGFPERALVLIEPDGAVSWSYQADSPGDLPPVELLLEAVAR